MHVEVVYNTIRALKEVFNYGQLVVEHCLGKNGSSMLLGTELKV